MISETLNKGLGRYAIGPKLRALRLRKKMGLVELGRHTSLSAAMLSKVERESCFPRFRHCSGSHLYLTLGWNISSPMTASSTSWASFVRRSASVSRNVPTSATSRSTLNLWISMR
jgi:hypothetical protein